MEVAYSHAQNQRLLKQRNLLLLAASALAVLAAILLLIGFSRDREVVLQPVLRSLRWSRKFGQGVKLIPT